MSGTRRKPGKRGARVAQPAEEDAGGFRGPGHHPRPYPIPDLGFSARRMEELEHRIRTIQVRWRPMSDSPEGLVKDLYELIAWVVDEDTPTCPVLDGTE